MSDAVTTETKTCICCREDLPMSAFEWRRDNKKFRPQCRVCRVAGVRSARHARPERHTLTTMIQRCHNQRHPKFMLYGGRGITVAPEWRAKGGFALFFAHIGPRPSPKHSIDRFPNGDGNYEPGNVRWATQPMQMRNTRNTKRIVVDGEVRPLIDVAAESRLDTRTIESRVANGATVEAALSKPGKPHRRMVTVDGVTRNCVEWSRALGGSDALVGGRLFGGWSEHDAVTTPPGAPRPSSERST